jgi:hypothetical protein
MDDAAFAAVSAHFNAQELIELTAVAAAFEFFPRFNSALRIPVTPLPQQNTELVREAVGDQCTRAWFSLRLGSLPAAKHGARTFTIPIQLPLGSR